MEQIEPSKPKHSVYSKRDHLKLIGILQLCLVVGIAAGLGLKNQFSSKAFVGHHSWCSSVIPSTFDVGTSGAMSAAVAINNNGSSTWSGSFGMSLLDRDNKWTITSGSSIPGSIGPGTRASFNVGLKAPATPGDHYFRPGIFIVSLGMVAEPCDTQSKIIKVTDKTPPTVSITAPANGATVSGNVTISATANDVGGSSLSKVVFIAPDVAIAEDTSSPYSYAWPSTSTANGSKTITVTAYDNAGNSASTTRTVTVSNTLIVPPPTTPPPTIPPSGGGTGSGGANSGSSSTRRGTTNQIQVTPDTSPPSEPINFTAQPSSDDGIIKLTWEAASDNVAVIGYSIERSEDNQTWGEIESNAIGLSFDDVSTSFDKEYFYRIRAFDGAGNKSGYVSTSAKSPSYAANVKANQDSSVDSEDGVATVTVKANSLAIDALCNITVLSGGTPDINGLATLAGPYKFSCRGKDGTPVEEFANPLQLSVHRDKQVFDGIDEVSYYAQGDDDWEVLSVQSSDQAAKQDSIELGQHRIFAIMGKPQQKSNKALAITFTIILLVSIVVAARFAIMYLLKRKALREYDEYLKKTQGL